MLLEAVPQGRGASVARGSALFSQRAGKNAPQLSTFDKDKDKALDFPEYLEFVRVTVQSAPPQPAPAGTP